ncbi:MAG: hypothetical protein WCK73_00050 [Deltaproteobacteria bacterium]
MNPPGSKSTDGGFLPFRAAQALGGSTRDTAAVQAEPEAGATRAEAWDSLLGWCDRAGMADGGLLTDREGNVLEIRGAPPPCDPAAAARSMVDALAGAPAAGPEGVAAALDLGATWITGFGVTTPAGTTYTAVFWGRAPLRATIRAPLARWIGEVLG